MLKVANSVINVSQITGVLPVVNGGTGVTTSTGTGNTVLSASPTLSGTIAAASQTLSGTLGVTGVSTLTGGAVIQGLTAGLGAGAVSVNTVFGYQSGNSIVANGPVVAMGYQAGKTYNAPDDWGSVFTGYQAGILTTGKDNTVVGGSALQTNGSGAANTAIGAGALRVNTASNNTAAGYQAGINISSGANNACFGYIAGTDTVRNITTNSNEIVMGNNSHTAAYIKVAWTVTSDVRDKTSFAPVLHGLAFVNSLIPIAYQFCISRKDKTAHGPIRYGFKAQDILVLEGANPVIVDNSDPENLKYNQDSMIAVLVNAIQELKAELDTAKTQIVALQGA